MLNWWAVYICWVLTPCQSLFAAIFSHSVGCLFVLLMISFAVRKLLNLIRSFLKIFFALIFFTLGDRSKNHCCSLCKSVLPTFSSRSFLVSGLTCRSVIHFEFIFAYGAGECSGFTLLRVAVQCPQHHLLERLFLNFKFLFLCHILNDSECMGLFPGSYSILLIYLFLCQYHTVLITEAL